VLSPASSFNQPTAFRVHLFHETTGADAFLSLFEAAPSAETDSPDIRLPDYIGTLPRIHDVERSPVREMKRA
jgi:hypothetical protein